MIHLTRALARRWLGTLLHIADTPERTAAAFALGVFIGFSPFLGLHTFIGIVLAFLLNVNRVAVLLGVYTNLPWILAPYYATATIAGAAITGHHIPPGFRTHFGALFDLPLYSSEFWTRLGAMLRPLVWPYAVGSTLAALALAAAAYPLALAFISSRKRIQKLVHKR